MFAPLEFAHDGDVLGFLKKTFLLLIVAGVAYALWPHDPSLDRFSSRSLSALDIAAWHGVEEGRPIESLMALYMIYDRQYGLPPVSAFDASWHALRAMETFSKAADRPDQESALPSLQLVFGILSTKAGMVGDSNVVARLELFEWMLADDVNRSSELTTAVAEKYALMHGVPAARLMDSASVIAKGVVAREERKWSAAERSLDQGLEMLQSTLSRLSAAE